MKRRSFLLATLAGWLGIKVTPPEVPRDAIEGRFDYGTGKMVRVHWVRTRRLTSRTGDYLPQWPLPWENRTGFPWDSYPCGGEGCRLCYFEAERVYPAWDQREKNRLVAKKLFQIQTRERL